MNVLIAIVHAVNVKLLERRIVKNVPMGLKEMIMDIAYVMMDIYL